LQTQLTASIEEIGREEKIASRPRYRFQLKIAKPLLLNKDLGKIVGFIIIYKLYIRMRIRGEIVKK